MTDSNDNPSLPTNEPVQQPLPLAFVHDEAVIQKPEDLYIPPDALEVILESFEGPLDLLLYLIRKQKFDITSMPVAEITRQYMEYVEVMRTLKLELAAEYLLMAAILAEIKSRLLLPKRSDDRRRRPLCGWLLGDLWPWQRRRSGRGAVSRAGQLPHLAGPE